MIGDATGTGSGKGKPRARRVGWVLAAAIVAVLPLAVGLAKAPDATAGTLPAGFQESIVFSGLTNPTAIEFASDGRVFVAEKSGLIKVFDSLLDTTPTVFADLRTNVHNFGDRGLLGLALHPNFPAVPYAYVLYTYDAEIGGVAPRWGTVGGTSDPCPNPPGATADGCVVSGRLSRLQAAGTVMTGSEQVLIEDWCQQYPSHSIGALAFGPDGVLYVSGGDGASYNFVDYGQDGNPLNPCGDPPVGVGGTQRPPGAEGGALRSQSLRRSPGEPVVLAGALLRVDPDTGAGLPGNALFASGDANARRIVAYGFRNPFRFTIRPGTSEIWVGDVGWNNWEEIDRVVAPTGGVQNFGWPCYEGAGRQGGYDSANLTICEGLYAEAGAVTAPFYTYHHSAQVVAGETCPTGGSSISGLAFYTGGTYPTSYNGALFFADYARDCIWVMFERGGAPDPSTRATFVAGAASPVELKIGPGGDLFYVDVSGGTIRRIQYSGAHQPPTALIQANPLSGPAPLTVSFDGSGSSDPDPGDAITAYAWDLDADGQYDDASTPQVAATYTVPGSYTVRLRVTDKHGATGTDSVVITVSNTAPTVTIDTPPASTTWKVGDPISFSGHATDQQDGTLAVSALSWSVILHHCSTATNCHEHPMQDFPAVSSGSFSASDHTYPSHLEIRLTATDSGGLADTKSVLLYPQTVGLTLQSSPSGLQLALNGTSGSAPFTSNVIIGSTNSIGGTSPQTLNGTQYEFASWSDGGAPTHNITAGAAPATYTATYRATSADLRIVKSAAVTATTITFTLTVTNLGPATAQNVVVTDTIPGKLQYSSGSPNLGSCSYNATTRGVTCSLATLNAAASWTIRITTTIGKKAGYVDNTARVSSSSPDLNTQNNSSTVRVRLR